MEIVKIWPQPFTITSHYNVTADIDMNNNQSIREIIDYLFTYN